MADDKIEGVVMVEEWSFEIHAPQLLPREYLMPDEVKIRKVVKAMKAETQIPGVRVFSKTGVRA